MSAQRTGPAAKAQRAAREPGELTPMLRHYLEVKSEHPDAVLLYRMGDFYELFFEDAVRAAPILEVALTARQRGTPSEAPMCGVPHHAVDGYIGKLLEAGLKVAVCDQVEDPKEAKGLVRREVTRIVTPGTVSDLELLEADRPLRLLAVAWRDGHGAGAFLDVTVGELTLRRWRGVTEARDDVLRLEPRELVYVESSPPEELLAELAPRILCSSPVAPTVAPTAGAARDLLHRALGVGSLTGFGLEEGEVAIEAAALAVDYAARAHQRPMEHLTGLQVDLDSDCLVLDEATVRNLELFRSQRDGGRRGSLLETLDATVTAPGGRLLRSWLARPLADAERITARLDAVEELLEGGLAAELQEGLRGVPDLERLTTRAVLGRIKPRELAALRSGLQTAPGLLALVADRRAAGLRRIGALEPASELCGVLEAALEEEPADALVRGGVIRPEWDEALAESRGLARGAQEHLLELERRERETTGIGSLKVRFNKVFGYFIEVTKSHQDKVPDRYTRKQTLANAERYVTTELDELEVRILSAQERQIELEEALYTDLVERVGGHAQQLQALAAGLAELDVLTSLATVARKRRYRRPELVDPAEPLVLEGSRHPVVERATADFVPNDCRLDLEERQIVVLTGPNMGGKSTYLRQVALAVILAQAGSFVPAERALIPLIDRVFTRVGASDNLARGESTFMVEMTETANILRYATRHSLIVLDEVGRGTATFDGLSLAWAIVEHLHETVGARTLFATHYHELTELAGILPRVANAALEVKEWEERILFLHRVVAGRADKSYGIQVARLAGLPEAVTRRARVVLDNLERDADRDELGRVAYAAGEGAPPSRGADQLALFDGGGARRSPGIDDPVVRSLREVDLERLTPLAALNLIATLKDRLEGRVDDGEPGNGGDGEAG